MSQFEPGSPYGSAPPPPPYPGTGGWGEVATGPQAYGPQSGGPVALPGGVELASAGIRVGAYFLSLLLAVVTLVIGYLIWSLVVWGDGTTPAYQLLGLRCYHVDERRKASWGAMALREVVGRGLIMGLIPIVSVIASIVSFVLFLSRSDRRGIPDLISGTVVVRDPSKILG